MESSHSYLIDNRPANNLSVTRIIKKFKKPFELEKMAQITARKQGTTVAHIKAEWEMNNLYSTTIGSMLHKYIENFYNNKKIKFEGSFRNLGYEEKQKIGQNLPKLIDYFQNFYKDNQHLLCLKSEVVLGDIDDTKVCGMSDMLCHNTEKDRLEIVDFKTNKKIEHSKYGNLLHPFEDMSEGEINEYTIQLNVYKYFVEKYTNLKIDTLKIVWFNVVNDNYKIFELDSIQPKIIEMFERFKSTSLFREQ